MTDKLITAIVIVAVALGFLAGAAAGIAYEKTQPVNVTVDALSGSEIAYTNDILLHSDQNLVMNANTNSTRFYNVTAYSIHAKI